MQIYRDVDRPATYRQGYVIALSLLCIALIVTFLLRFSLIKENHRRDHLLSDEYNRETVVVEAYDWVRIEALVI
jgi:hypothetical protein